MSVTPTPQQWEQLWGVCEEVGVWSWPARPDAGCDGIMFDGLCYSLVLDVGTRAVHSEGQLANVPVAFQKQVKRFYRALQILAGWDVTGSAGSREFYADLNEANRPQTGLGLHDPAVLDPLDVHTG